MASIIFDLLREKICDIKTPLTLGIDPRFDVNDPLVKKYSLSPEAYIKEFSLKLIECSNLPAVKIQSAFFEAYGCFSELKIVCEAVKRKGMILILDGKRGDIGSTMQAYGKAAFDHFGADILTVTPFLGEEVLSSLSPWLEKDKGVYVVSMTSNTGGEKIQSKVQNDLFKMYENYKNIGLVLGLNKVDTLDDSIFSKYLSYPLLLPGMGAQNAHSNKMTLLTENNRNLFPVSRGISQLSAAPNSWDEFQSQIEKNTKTFRNKIS